MCIIVAVFGSRDKINTADPPRLLARQMQPQHRQPPRCNPKPARRSRGSQPLSQPNTPRHSQPSPRHKGAWGTADQASATAAILRPASGRPGSILEAACLTAGRKRSPEGSRTKKESISSTPGLLRCLMTFGGGFEILGLLIYT